MRRLPNRMMEPPRRTNDGSEGHAAGKEFPPMLMSDDAKRCSRRAFLGTSAAGISTSEIAGNEQRSAKRVKRGPRCQPPPPPKKNRRRLAVVTTAYYYLSHA